MTLRIFNKPHRHSRISVITRHNVRIRFEHRERRAKIVARNVGIKIAKRADRNRRRPAPGFFRPFFLFLPLSLTLFLTTLSRHCSWLSPEIPLRQVALNEKLAIVKMRLRSRMRYIKIRHCPTIARRMSGIEIEKRSRNILAKSFLPMRADLHEWEKLKRNKR